MAGRAETTEVAEASGMSGVEDTKLASLQKERQRLEELNDAQAQELTCCGRVLRVMKPRCAVRR